LEINPRTLADWKKGRVKVYERLKWSYKAELLLKELESVNNEMEAKIIEVLGNS